MLKDRGEALEHQGRHDRQYFMFAVNMLLSLMVMYVVMFSMTRPRCWLDAAGARKGLVM
jgi:hypothetical protein